MDRLEEVLRAVLRHFVRSGDLDEPHEHGGVRVSTSEVIALDELVRSPGITQHELGRRLGLEKSTVSRLAGGLIERGWLARERDPGNRRFHRLELTGAGRAVADRVGADIRERHASLFRELTGEERAGLALGLTGLARVLQRHRRHHHGDRHEHAHDHGQEHEHGAGSTGGPGS